MFLERYGVLHPKKWVKEIYMASRELFRVLKPHGLLIFKWANSPHGRNLEKVLPLFPVKPFFGSVNPTQRTTTKTFWIVFRKDE